MALRASRDSDRGASFVSYAALVMLVSVVAAAVLGSADIPTATATLYHDAICAVGGGDDEDCDDGAVPPELPEDEEEQVELVITVAPNSSTPPETWTLTCSPAGGSHPDPEAACAALQEADMSVPEPVPEGELCTMQHGGTNTATISGSIGDTEVSEEFNRVGGCEISRWEAMAALISP